MLHRNNTHWPAAQANGPNWGYVNVGYVQGQASVHITIAKLKALEVSIKASAIETDNGVAKRLKAITGSGRLPWNRAK